MQQRICRGIDAVAPVIHEWTYEAMAYDLLDHDLQANVFHYTAETAGGKAEPKEHLLDERDELCGPRARAFRVFVLSCAHAKS